MAVRRFALYAALALSLASLAVAAVSLIAQHGISQQLAETDARLAALRSEVVRGGFDSRVEALSGTGGRVDADAVAASGSAPALNALADRIKRQLQEEMGLFSVRLLRERRDSFVELNAYDNFGKTNYGTAGYLGGGYFITVKHAVIALEDPEEGQEARRITSIRIRYRGRELDARVVDSGNANVEVHPGDWAIIKVNRAIDLPPVRVDTGYAYEFAEPVFRLGNDYSKGIILSTGYIGQKQANGLVTCLTDGHPGVSGGGVLNQAGSLVGIPIGRMQGDYRFSFILPVRPEMFRRVPGAGQIDDAAPTAG